MTTAPINVTASAGAGFRIATVLGSAFMILCRNFLTFFLLATITILPNLVLYQIHLNNDPGPSYLGVWFLLARFVGVVLSYGSGAVIVFAALQTMRNRPVRAAESLKIGLDRLLPIIGVTICTSIPIFLGYLVFIIPGVIINAILFVTIPACIAEELGPLQSMTRSAGLTRGHWIKLFLLLLFPLGIEIVKEFVKLLQPSFVDVYRLDLSLLGVGRGTLWFVGFAIWQMISGAFWAITAVVVYHDLRVAKEGVAIGEIAAVLDHRSMLGNGSRAVSTYF
jgi:hypothetical protein